MGKDFSPAVGFAEAMGWRVEEFGNEVGCGLVFDLIEVLGHKTVLDV